MLKAYKYRLYPNKDQRLYLAKTFGCTRLIYNLMLSERIETYNKYKDDKEELKKQKYPTPAKYKVDYEFLKEVDSLALANAQMNLDKAYKTFSEINQWVFQNSRVRKTIGIVLQQIIKKEQYILRMDI